jgi:uncharacterized phage protein (TIGR02218 family)
MDQWLEGPVTSVVYGWRLERRDGVTLGFTSHDKDVIHNGLLLRSSPGMKPTTIVESVGFETDGLEVSGALTSDLIRQDDLARGKWDGARLEIFLFDWENPGSGQRLLAIGELGSISFSGNSFEVEFLGLGQLLDRAVVPQTSPYCRAQFCDSQCGLNRQRFSLIATVNRVLGDRIEFQSALPGPFGSHAFGELRWLNGSHNGIVVDIIASDANSVTMPQAPGAAIRPGDLVELLQGCDKQIATCATRFSNAVNFRGEPYLPGNDLLTRYPGAN